MSYLLSIVIPTQNRQQYCALTVKQIYEATDEQVQIIVQDNSSDASLKQMIEAESYEDRVRYYYIPQRIPCAENYNIAIEHAGGEYVCCIGDDDGVFAQIVDMVEFAKAHGIDAICPNVGAVYYWPAVSDDTEGKLLLGKHNATYRFADPKKHLKKLLEEGCQNYLTMDLVKAYHGVVKKACFEEVYKRTGKYCGALSSDMFMCVTLSLVVDRVLVIDHPLTISGACRQSTSGDAINKCNFGKLETAPHFVGQEYTWSDRVPAFYSGNTIWADSALHAFAEMGEEKWLEHYNLEKLTALCLHKFPQFKEEIMENFRNNAGNKRQMKDYLFQQKKAQMIERIKILASPFYQNIKALLHVQTTAPAPSFGNCENIIEAETTLRPLVDETIQELLNRLSKDVAAEA